MENKLNEFVAKLLKEGSNFNITVSIVTDPGCGDKVIQLQSDGLESVINIYQQTDDETMIDIIDEKGNHAWSRIEYCDGANYENSL